MRSKNGRFTSNGSHDPSAQSIYGDVIRVNRVRRLVAEVLERRGMAGNGLAQNGQPVTNAPMTARATWLDQGTEDSLDVRRSVWDECGYPPTSMMSPQRYQILYDRNSTAATVVEAMARYAWQVSPEVYEKERGKMLTAFERSFFEVGCQLRSGGMVDHFGEDKGSPIWEVLERVDGLSGIGRYGIVVYGLNDGLRWDQPVPGIEEVGSQPGEQAIDEDTGKPKVDDKGQPVVNVNRGDLRRYSLNFATPDRPDLQAQTEGRKLGYMSAFAESLVRVNRWETNKQSPRFGRPVSYHVTFQDPKNPMWGVGTPMTTENVHWTRVQHVADTSHAYTSSLVMAFPRCQQVLNHVLALDKVYHGGAEGYWKHCFPYLFLSTHPQLGGDVDVDDEAVKDMIEDMMNGLQKAGVLTGMGATTVGGQVADPTPQINAHLEAISIKKRMPVRILKGSERGELSSAQDDDSWDDQVVHHENSYETPCVVRPCVNALVLYGVVKPPETPKGLKAFWPDVTSMSAEQKAQIASQRASAMSQYVNGGISNMMTEFDWLTREMDYSEEEATAILQNAGRMAEDSYEGDESFTEVPEQVEDWVPPDDGKDGAKDEAAAPPQDGQGPSTGQGPTGNDWSDAAREAAAEARKGRSGGGVVDKEQALKDYKGMIVKFAKRYADRNNMDDLVQEGSVGLMKAADSYDPEKGASFGTHAFYAIRASIQDAARRMGRQPKGSGDVGSEQGFDPVDATPHAAPAHEDVEKLLSKLDQRSAGVLRQKFGLDDGVPKTLDQISEGLGITKQRASQIYTAAVGKLQGVTNAEGMPPVEEIAALVVNGMLQGNARMCWGKPCDNPGAVSLKEMHEAGPEHMTFERIDAGLKDVAQLKGQDFRDAVAHAVGPERAEGIVGLGSKKAAMAELEETFKGRLESHQRTQGIGSSLARNEWDDLTDNAWSDESRAAALEARKQHSIAKIKRLVSDAGGASSKKYSSVSEGVLGRAGFSSARQGEGWKFSKQSEALAGSHGSHELSYQTGQGSDYDKAAEHVAKVRKHLESQGVKTGDVMTHGGAVHRYRFTVNAEDTDDFDKGDDE